MRDRAWKLRIEDILDAINEIHQFTSGMTYETFCADRKTINAVLYSVAVIGEGARHVPQEIRASYPEIPWKEMGNIRNVVVHEYFGIDLDILWATICNELPPVALLLRQLLETGPTSKP
jgi:uncharacterized protein with HEPN domain